MLNTDKLLKLRKSKKITQKEMASNIGVVRTTYVRYENGEIQPPTDMVAQLANFFKVSVDYLLDLTDDPIPPDVIPDRQNGVQDAFHRGEFEDLTQDEVDALAVIAKTLKEQRIKEIQAAKEAACSEHAIEFPIVARGGTNETRTITKEQAKIARDLRKQLSEQGDETDNL